MSRNRNRNQLQNTFKDYLVPIVWGVILLVLLFNIFSWEDTASPVNTSTSENTNSVSVDFRSEDTQAFIMYPWDERKEIVAWAELFKWETLIVREWVVDLRFENNNNISLNRVAELKYNEDSSLSFFSSEAWLKLVEDTSIAMRYLNIQSPGWSILSISQNEASSSVYVLSWSAKITNLWWASTSLVSGQKISVSRQFASDWDADLAWDKTSIDSFFKSSDWFLDNDGINALSAPSDNIENIESETSSGSLWWDSGIFLAFDSIRDEWNTTSSTIDVSGNILSELVELVTIDGKQAEISWDNTFLATWINTSKSVNDVVIKIYDEDRAILDKKVITLYNSSPSSTSWVSPNEDNSSSSTNNQAISTNSQWVTTFWVDATDFGFTMPSSSGEFATTGSEVTIRWITTAENISKVEVNGFELASFNGSTWRYHAFERFETLESGTNQYRIDYYWDNGSIVYTDYYTIVKRDAQPTTTSTPEETVEESTETENPESSEIPPEETLFQ